MKFLFSKYSWGSGDNSLEGRYHDYSVYIYHSETIGFLKRIGFVKRFDNPKSTLYKKWKWAKWTTPEEELPAIKYLYNTTLNIKESKKVYKTRRAAAEDLFLDYFPDAL